MPRNRNDPVRIVRRLSDGSFCFVENQDPRRCDIDGAELWATSSGQLYCDEIHARPNGTRNAFSEVMSTKPHEISIGEWKEIIALPAVQESWGLDGNVTAEAFAEMVYGVRFDFVSGSPGYIGDLYILSGDAIGEPLSLIRRNGSLEVV